jgi:hypothetical protein
MTPSCIGHLAAQFIDPGDEVFAGSIRPKSDASISTLALTV